VVCLAPRAPGGSVRPRRVAGVSARPLNFTVRRRHEAPTQGSPRNDLRRPCGDDARVGLSAKQNLQFTGGGKSTHP